MTVQLENTLKNTVCNKYWVLENLDRLRKIFPETWTHMHNINLIAVGYQLKLLGVDYRTDAEFAECFASMEKFKVIIREGALIRRTT